MSELRTPLFGADMLHGTLVRCNVRVGDTVHRGDIVGEIESFTAVFDIDSSDDGIGEGLLVAEATHVLIQVPLARLPTSTPGATALGATATEVASVRPVWTAMPPATEIGVDLAAVRGTGDGGAITRAYSERAAQEIREHVATAASAAVVPAAPAVERPLPTDGDR